MRLNTRINLVNRLALMIEQRNIHVVFAWEFAAAEMAPSGALAWICPCRTRWIPFKHNYTDPPPQLTERSETAKQDYRREISPTLGNELL
jgi:hypothetical protein